MKNYLVRWKSNWADEIDLDGVVIFKEINEDEVKMLKKLKLSSVGAIDAIEYILNGEFIYRFDDLGDDKQVKDVIGKEAYDKYTDYYELDD